MAAVIVVLVILVLVLLFLFSAIKVAREYERGVVFRLGRLLAVKGVQEITGDTLPSTASR